MRFKQKRSENKKRVQRMKDNLKIVLVSALVALVAVGVVSVVARPNTKELVEAIKNQLGAFPGPEISSEFLSVNGVKQWHFSKNFSAATASTTCSFKLPNATTTPLLLGMKVATSSRATVLEIGNSALVDATTTSLALRTVTSSAPSDLVATNTASILSATGNTFRPNTYINVKVGGHALVSGSCVVIVAEL